MTVSFGWGPVEARTLAPAAACLVVVDVLSFTTSVGVAVERGTAVLPYRWRDATAVAYAREREAVLAVGRSEATGTHPWTLSPAALRAAPSPSTRCSPNSWRRSPSPASGCRSPRGTRPGW